jgi:hypothetical protein
MGRKGGEASVGVGAHVGVIPPGSAGDATCRSLSVATLGSGGLFSSLPHPADCIDRTLNSKVAGSLPWFVASGARIKSA